MTLCQRKARALNETMNPLPPNAYLVAQPVGVIVPRGCFAHEMRNEIVEELTPIEGMKAVQN